MKVGAYHISRQRRSRECTGERSAEDSMLRATAKRRGVIESATASATVDNLRVVSALARRHSAAARGRIAGNIRFECVKAQRD